MFLKSCVFHSRFNLGKSSMCEREGDTLMVIVQTSSVHQIQAEVTDLTALVYLKSVHTGDCKVASYWCKGHN